MNGMHTEQWWALTGGSDDFTVSHDYELPPTPTTAQITLGSFYEFDDKSHVDLGFTSCAYLDKDGVTRTDPFPDIDAFDAVHVFGRNGLVRADFQIRVSHIGASYVVNFFFWDNVS
jgi:hypothetical protein